MLIHANDLRSKFRTAGTWLPSHPSPESAARIITCGFSQLQRIGGGAQINMWHPKHVGTDATKPIPLQWVAIRQVEILFEGSHIELFNMEMENFKRSLRSFCACRAGGQRLAIVVGGIYQGTKASQDRLAFFDATLRDRLHDIVNILWLDEFSETFTGRAAGNTGSDITKLLPYVGTALGARQLFQKKTSAPSSFTNTHDMALNFISAVDAMPRSCAKEYSVLVGLKIPTHRPDNDIDWVTPHEFQRLPFMQALHSVFNTFGMDTPTTHHPRGHGDHMNYQKRADPAHFLRIAPC
ncbi:MAG: hypothetical protein WBK91_04900 [Alphaproteobacteria bacterium]